MNDFKSLEFNENLSFILHLKIIYGLCELCMNCAQEFWIQEIYHDNMDVLLRKSGLFVSNFYQFTFMIFKVFLKVCV